MVKRVHGPRLGFQRTVFDGQLKYGFGLVEPGQRSALRNNGPYFGLRTRNPRCRQATSNMIVGMYCNLVPHMHHTFHVQNTWRFCVELGDSYGYFASDRITRCKNINCGWNTLYIIHPNMRSYQISRLVPLGIASFGLENKHAGGASMCTTLN